MGAEGVGRVTCGECGAERSPELIGASNTPPCPECGETAITLDKTLAFGLGITSSVVASLRPAEQERTWERRWQDAQDQLARLLAPRTEPLSAGAIHNAHADLQAFYVQTYHLKDSLKEASGTTGVSGQTIENAITHDSDLALLAVLANLDKHGLLNRAPRSGYAPKLLSIGGTTGREPASGEWQLDVSIEHRGNHLDGLDIAGRAVSAWRRTLQHWNLV